MSESWERPNQTLEKKINLPGHTVVSNPHQRKGQRGRPALIINHKKYQYQNITQLLITIPLGTEAVWAIITPKNTQKDSKIKKMQKMEINEKKTKALIINFTKNHQFTTRINLKGESIDIVDSMKILGVTINN